MGKLIANCDGKNLAPAKVSLSKNTEASDAAKGTVADFTLSNLHPFIHQMVDEGRKTVRQLTMCRTLLQQELASNGDTLRTKEDVETKAAKFSTRLAEAPYDLEACLQALEAQIVKQDEHNQLVR